MQKLIIGTIIGIVIGILFGASVVTPRLTEKATEKLNASSGVAIGPPAQTEVLQLDPEPETENKIIPTPLSDGVHLKMASAYDSTLPLFGTLAKRLEEQIAITTGGALTIEVYEPNTLAPADELYEAVRSGAIEAAFTTPFMDIDQNNSLGLFGASPFGPGPIELLAWFYKGGGRPNFETIYHTNGLHAEVCGMLPGEPAGWFNREITSPDDFNGLRMRIEGLAARTLEKLGVTPLQLDAQETFRELSEGNIDAAEFSLPSLDITLNLHKAAQYYYFPGWHQRATLLTFLVSLDTWMSFNDQQRSQIRAVCGDNTRQGLAEGEAVQFESLKVFSAYGTTFNRFSPDVLAALEEAWASVIKDELSKDKEFRRIWKSLSLFRRNYDIWNELNDM